MFCKLSLASDRHFLMGKGKRAEERAEEAQSCCCGWKITFDETDVTQSEQLAKLPSTAEYKKLAAMPVFDTPCYAASGDCFSCFSSASRTVGEASAPEPTPVPAEIRLITKCDTHPEANMAMYERKPQLSESNPPIIAEEVPLSKNVTWSDQISVYHEVPDRCVSRGANVERLDLL